MANVNVFEGVEAFAALELIDVAVMINVQLVFAQDGDGGNLIKGKNQGILTLCDNHAVTVERNRGIGEEGYLALAGNDAGDVDGVLENGGFGHGCGVASVDVLLLIVIPFGKETEGEIEADTLKLLGGEIADLLAAALAGDGIPMAFKSGKAAIGAYVGGAFEILRAFFVVECAVGAGFIDIEAVADEGEKLVTVAPLGGDEPLIYANTFDGKDSMRLTVSGHESQTMVTALFDNLGKGASGAAIQNMNILLGVDEATGLNI